MGDNGNHALGNQSEEANISGFDPFRCPWSQVEEYYAMIGISLDFLNSPEIEDHKLSVAIRYRADHVRPYNYTFKFEKLDRALDMPPNSWHAVGLKRRILRNAAMLRCLQHKDLVRVRKRAKGIMRSYAWRSWTADLHAMCELASIAVKRLRLREDRGDCPDGVRLFKHLTAEDLLTCTAHRYRIHILDKRMRMALEQGLIDDWMTHDLQQWSMEGLKREKAKKMNRELKPKGQNEYEPFSDEVATIILRTCLALSEVGDDLCDIWKSDEVRKYRAASYNARRAMPLNGFIRQYRGKHIKSGKLPFQFAVGRDFRPVADLLAHRTPLKFLGSITTQVQSAHQQILNFMFSARAGEIAMLPFDAVRYRKDDGFHALTGPFFKQAFGANGDLRHWPVPEHAVTVILRQQRLKTAYADDDRPDLLWWQHDYGLSERYLDFWDRVRSIDDPERLLPQSETVIPTRFRATMARLTALAVPDGINVVRRVFNHANSAETAAYANAKGDLDNELLSILWRKERNFNGSDKDGTIPPDTGRIQSAIEILGTEDPESVADLLGEGARMTAPGVFCIRRPNQVGDCANEVRNCNPELCDDNKQCAFRLTTHEHLVDQGFLIEEHIEMLEKLESFDPDNFTFFSIMAGLLDCFHRIDGPVAEKINHPTLVKAVQSVNGGMLGKLTDNCQKAVENIRNAIKGNPNEQ